MRSLALLALFMGCVPSRCCGSGTSKIDNLIVFGDSYSDEGRLDYFLSHNNTPPPPGLYIPEANLTKSGGKSWPQLAAKAIGATTFNYAGKRTVAMCLGDLASPFAAPLPRDRSRNSIRAQSTNL